MVPFLCNKLYQLSVTECAVTLVLSSITRTSRWSSLVQPPFLENRLCQPGNSQSCIDQIWLSWLMVWNVLHNYTVRFPFLKSRSGSVISALSLTTREKHPWPYINVVTYDSRIAWPIHRWIAVKYLLKVTSRKCLKLVSVDQEKKSSGNINSWT